MKEKKLKDKVFAEEMTNIRPFEFNENVAHVFDDMAGRSIPYYTDVQKLTTRLAVTFFQKGSSIYDLGSSTATSIALISESLKENNIEDYTIYGIDSSAAMCREAEVKLKSIDANMRKIHLEEGDITNFHIENASVVIMNYTLQFVDPLKREKIISNVYKGLKHNGILLLSGKTLQSNTDISRIFIDNYYDLKRKNGYSELEISQKREALENVQIPYTVKENETLFRNCGFESVDIFYSWFNFTSFICMKKDDKLGDC